MVLGARGHVGSCDARAIALFGAFVLMVSCGESKGNRGTPNVAGQSSGASGGSGGATGGGGGTKSGSGGTSGTSGTSSGRGGTAGSGGGSGSAGTGGTSGSNSAGGNGGAGSGAEGGMSSGAGGTGGGGSGEAGAGGNGGMREPDGLICQSPERCDPGERCTLCTTSEGNAFLCVPNPDDDPTGFAAATEDCAPGVGDHFAECDGPEDCPIDRSCVWGNDTQATYGGQCVTEAELPQVAGCCFSCGAPPLCILCDTDADCPETRECTEVVGAPSGVNGCLPR